VQDGRSQQLSRSPVSPRRFRCRQPHHYCRRSSAGRRLLQELRSRRAAGVTPLHVGDPAIARRSMATRDGVACE
jgi:hypothetical protein